MLDANKRPDGTLDVTGQAKRGAFLRGQVLKLSADRIHFELLDPFTDVQVSDAVTSVKVLIEGREAYEGAGTIASLSPLRGGHVCELALASPWREGATTSPAELRAGFTRFLEGWEGMRKLQKEYLSAVIDLHTFLGELQAWLEPTELAARLAPETRQELMRKEAIQALAPGVVNMIEGLYERFEHAAASVREGQEWEHRLFAQRLVHPFILQSPFVHRTFFKPLGYPGDYEMVDMMFRDPDEGSTLLGRLVNIYALQLPPILSHRSRIEYLYNLLGTEVLRVQAGGRPLRVLSMGAGPAQEVQRFVREFARGDQAEFTLMDADQRTVDHLGEVFSGHQEGGGKKPRVRVESKSILGFLKGIKRVSDNGAEGYDFVYCAGLFDYLPDSLCTSAIEAFYQIVAPGGLVVVTNVDDNPSRREMEVFLEWFVIPRDSEQMKGLMPSHIPHDQVTLISDQATGANIFMEVRKPGS